MALEMARMDRDIERQRKRYAKGVEKLRLKMVRIAGQLLDGYHDAQDLEAIAPHANIDRAIKVVGDSYDAYELVSKLMVLLDGAG